MRNNNNNMGDHKRFYPRKKQVMWGELDNARQRSLVYCRPEGKENEEMDCCVAGDRRVFIISITGEWSIVSLGLDPGILVQRSLRRGL